MTLTPEGGAAIPVSVTTTRKVQGGAAIPVYGYMTAPTDGRPAMGGSAIPVRVLTAADLKVNGGQWTLEGRPYAMPVYTAPAGVTVQGGPALAVYPVNVWPTVPPVTPPVTPVTYLFRDDFTTTEAAPLASPRACEPGPGTWTIVDTGNYANITGAALNITNTTANQDPLLISGATYALGAGKMLAFRCKGAAIGDRMQIGINPPYVSWDVQNLSGSVIPGYLGNLFTQTADAYGDYILSFHTDRQVLIRGDTVIYVAGEASPTVANIRINRQEGAAARSFDFVRLASGNISTRWDTDFGIVTSRTASASAGATATASPMAVIEATRTIATNDVYELMVRRTDDNNCWIVRCNQAGSTIKLIEKIGGVETERSSAAQTWTNGTAYRIVVIVDALNIKTFVADVAKHVYTAASYNMEATGVKTSHAVANLICWPRKLAHSDYLDLQRVTGTGVNLYTTPIPNSAAPLTTPTYDGTGKAIHPDVLDMGAGNSWNGKRYWMSMTPYPGGNSAFENPSILCGDDGTTWAVPVGLTNPIDAAPAVGYNSDSSLVFSADGTTLWCFYRETDDLTRDYIRAKSSTDGVTWSDEIAVFDVPFTQALSPSVLYDGGQFVMWCVDGTQSPKRITRRTSAALGSGWSAPQNCADDTSVFGSEPWHIDVIKNGSTYVAYILTLAFLGTVATGLTGTDWTCKSVQLSPLGSWGPSYSHRGSLVALGSTTYDLWYASANSPNVNIGRTTVQVV